MLPSLVEPFWKECAENRATIIQYVGELCRYLVAYHRRAPSASAGHSLRAAIGNGLGSDIWQQFQEGFHLPLVVEFYAATEANATLVNVCRSPDESDHPPRNPLHLRRLESGKTFDQSPQNVYDTYSTTPRLSFQTLFASLLHSLI